MLRTHTCGQIREADIGKSATLAGWVDTIRDHGGVTFLDLRDEYGVTQIVFHDSSLPGGIHKETTVQITGLIEKREEDTINPKLATGLVELAAGEVTILGPCLHALPFEISESTETREEVRLKYRFLDLRNPKLHDNIKLRANVIKQLRASMDDLGFTEIQTPILTASSPEGARDYLVPSRKHKGKFYALPQAPQQFKQMLMASGFDKYYQIAPCFRDEDARGDRSPGEFYQLDFEMAFCNQEDVFEVAEQVVGGTFRKMANKRVTEAPFPRITYRDSMLKYGTDKPDLRNPLIIRDLTEFFSDVDFPLFRDMPVRGIVADASAMSKKFFASSLEYAMGIGMKGLGYLTRTGDGFKGPIDKFLSPEKKQTLIEDFSIGESETIFFICDHYNVVDKYAGQIRTWLGETLKLLDQDLFAFCFIVDYPMYEENEETGAIDFIHNPFSMPQGGLAALQSENPLDVLAYQYDIVCNGVELSSGAVRNHDPEIMKKAFSIAGYSEEELETKFGALYTAFQYGAPPHAGMAPGVDRMVMLLAEEETIRDVIAFPLNGNAQDLLMGAPSEVTELQLREAHIKVR